MSVLVPTNCANPQCREPSVKPIHCASQEVAIDAIDGPSVFSHFITYRCSECGHTWAAQGYSAEEHVWPARGRRMGSGDEEISFSWH